ncbi:MAG: extracellular solute-binding protein [Proteobacteria bacterium]|nr:extracellular solute-binding protein [Pseudomonadota bacterium]HAH16738.1 hypothetical protein [Chloroflexota bacterium]NBT04723.1 extracellular solute-binding protein [Pseudomonadota bacterium]NBT19392.1 extracellular solute-binding protein [Pseudomonadota bacterium]NBY48034.1 extracellular solute-binding protein [Pseudomonadota bacterium]
MVPGRRGNKMNSFATGASGLTRRKALFGVLGTSALASACGADEAKPAAPAPTQAAALAPKPSVAATTAPAVAPTTAPSAQPVTIKYITEPGRVDSGVKDAVNAYNALGRKITVELEGVPGNFGEKVLTLGAAGSLPELTHSHPRDYHPWRTGGLLVPLDDRLKIEKDAADLVPAALDYWLMDGQRWAVPYNLSVQNMYFNREIFEKAGQKTPDEYEKEGKWTWETYLDLARKLTSGSGDTKVFGCVWMATFLDIQLGVIWPFGGDLWDKERKKTVLDSKAALDAIQFQADLAGKYAVSPNDEEWKQFASAPSATWGAAFGAGRAAMELQPNDSLAPHVLASTFRKGMAPMPKGPGGRIVRGLSVGVHLFKGSKQTDAAWNFAMYHSGKETEKLMLDRHLTLPWRISTQAAIATAMPLKDWESSAAYGENMKAVRPTPYVAKFADINKVYNDAYIPVRAGQKTAVQMMVELKPQIEELLK